MALQFDTPSGERAASCLVAPWIGNSSTQSSEDEQEEDAVILSVVNRDGEDEVDRESHGSAPVGRCKVLRQIPISRCTLAPGRVPGDVSIEDELSEAISSRASRISQLGVYWGFSEWIAWGWRHSTRVLMMFADNVVDLFAVFTTPEIGAQCCCRRTMCVYVSAWYFVCFMVVVVCGL